MTITKQKSVSMLELWYRDRLILSCAENKYGIELIAGLISDYGNKGFIAKNSYYSPNIFHLKTIWEYKIA